MKTKIITLSIVAVLAFSFSSFRYFTSEKIYFAINKSNAKWHQNDAMQAKVSCAKCHDCQKQELLVEDSTSISSQKYFTNLNVNSTENTTIVTENSEQVKRESCDLENPRNSKSN